MKIPSETVQAAQRLLAERERVGLAKYGTTVDRTDLSPEQWAQHLVEELLDAALYVLRLKQSMRELEDNARAMAAGQCVHPRGVIGDPHGRPACPITGQIGEVMANEAHAVPAGEGAEAALQQAIDLKEFPNLAEFVENAPKVLERYGARDLGELIKKLKAERAARWANAPAEATHLSQSPARNCFWHTEEPRLPPLAGDWTGGLIGFAGRDLLGLVACEPRPWAEGER